MNRQQNKSFSFAFVLVSFFLTFSSALAQPLDLGSVYDFNSFSTVPAQFGKQDYVKLKAAHNGRYMIVEATVEKGWHLYSVTQPDGGTIPSTFRFYLPEIEIEEIRPLTEPHVDGKVPGFNVDIESHDNAVTWVFTFTDPLPKDQPIEGELSGQVCQDGEGGTCIPITVPFKAYYDAELDAKPFVDIAQTIKDRFVFRQKDESAKSVAEKIENLEFKPQEKTQVTGFATALFYAFLGGIILNFMPCVLPVIGLKILSFFEQAGKSRGKAFVLNLWYSLGLLSVFMVLAYLTYGLSILFTFDLFNIIMACVVFAMALSLMDVWELSVPALLTSRLGSSSTVKLTQQEGAFGAFFKGIITTLLAIPCGAPLLSPAINWADMQIRSGNTTQVFIAYGMIGLGMASPYLIIGAFPELLRFLPKPGGWMETFKKTMGFFLLIAVVWILYFVQMERILPTIALLFALWFACWMVGRLGYTAKPKQRLQAWIISLAVVLIVLFFAFDFHKINNPYTLENAMKSKIYGNQDGEYWTPYSPEVFEKALAAGKPVLVDFTADWCVNCKVLEATVLHSDAVLKKLKEKQAVSLVADCTKEGPGKVFLRKFGADQVPVLALFNPKKPTEPIVLRGAYTQNTLLEILNGLE